MTDKDLEEIEIQLFLEGIYRHYGWDFRDYALSSLKRRIRACLQEEKVKTISGLQDKILHDPSGMERFLNAVSISVTGMFRDPGFFLALRKKVIPLFKELPFARIWDTGCGTGEEVYSLAITLHEENLNDRVRIYATDMNEEVLKKDQEGIFPLERMKEYTENYLRAGGTKDFSAYYSAKYENAIFRPAVKKEVVWSQHNLVTDASFNEFQLILCRNVMIYFNKALQERVHKLLYESLAPGGFLGLGSKESLKFTPCESCYEVVDGREEIYRRIP